MSLVTLPEGFGDLAVEDALKALLGAVLSDRAVYFELSRRHAELVRWIEED